MNICRVFFLLMLSLFFISPAFADSPGANGPPSDVILEIAKIMHRLKHFPSPGGKKTLQTLATEDSTTANERTLITAMLNLQHHVNAADKAGLTALVQNPKVTKYERSIATILLNLDHRPTKQDKAVLADILGK